MSKLKIGLEVHGYLLTHEKLFCRCKAEHGAKKVEPNTTPKDYIVKVVPLVPAEPIFVDVRTINRSAAEFIGLQKVKEAGKEFVYYTTKVTDLSEVKHI